MHANMSQERLQTEISWKIGVENWRGPDRAQNEDTHFVQACAVEVHLEIAQDQFNKEF
jgi:hypothetical protein